MATDSPTTDVEWRAIPGWPYEVSNCGDIRRTKGGKNTEIGRLLLPMIDYAGYRRVQLTDKGRRQRYFVHRLVCEVFHGPKPGPCHHVAHADGSRANNSAANLRWALPAENFAGRWEHGAYPVGEMSPGAKLSWSAVRKIRELYAKAERKKLVARGTVETLAKRYGVTKNTIHRIVSEKTWVHGA